MLCLVVDDSKSARYTLQKALKQLGHEIILAASGEEALEMLCEHTPGIIFLDHLMPGLDGFATAKKIRSQKVFKETPVVMCTAKDNEDYAVDARKIGVFATLPKPASQEQLQQIFTQVQADLTPTAAEETQKPAAQPIVNQPKPVKAIKPLNVQPDFPPQAKPQVSMPSSYQINEDIRTLIRDETEGRARDSAQKLLNESWGRLRGGLQEDVRKLTSELMQKHLQSALDGIIGSVRTALVAQLTTEFRQYSDKRLDAIEHQLINFKTEQTNKLSSMKRQYEMQKIDPIALHDTILEDAKKAAEFTATHKTVETVKKVSYEICEDIVGDLLDSSTFEQLEHELKQLKASHSTLQAQGRKQLMITSFAAVVAGLALAVAVSSFL